MGSSLGWPACGSLDPPSWPSWSLEIGVHLAFFQSSGTSYSCCDFLNTVLRVAFKDISQLTQHSLLHPVWSPVPVCAHLRCSLTPSLSTEKFFIAPHLHLVAGTSDSWRLVFMCLTEAKEDIKYLSPSQILCDEGLYPFQQVHISFVFTLRIPSHLPHTCIKFNSGLLWLFSLHSCKPQVSPGSSQPGFHFLHTSFLCFSFGRSCVFIHAGCLPPLHVWIEIV